MVGLWECWWLPPTLGGSDWSMGEWGLKARPPAPMGATQKGHPAPQSPSSQGLKSQHCTL